jgi:hypothetical protein
MKHCTRDEKAKRWVAVLPLKKRRKRCFPDKQYIGGKQEAFEAMKLFVDTFTAGLQDGRFTRLYFKLVNGEIPPNLPTYQHLLDICEERGIPWP